MKLLSLHPRLHCQLALTALLLAATALHAQTSPVRSEATAHSEHAQHLRSHIFLYDLRDNTSRLIFTADSIWEAPNWSPDGRYLIANSNGTIYRLLLQLDGTAKPERLSIPADYQCNNDKAISPDGKHLAFSASIASQPGSRVFLADDDGNHIHLLTAESPSYFHAWSPDSRTLAFVAQRNASGQFDIYRMPATGGPEQQLTSDPHQDDGPDYSPDGRWIYLNSDRTGKQAIWRIPADGAGPDDAKAQRVVSDALEDWFPHISPDGKKMVYIGYPAGTPTHNPRTAAIALKLVTIDHDQVAASQKTLVQATGGQGTLNVNSWAPDSRRFAYVTYEVLP